MGWFARLMFWRDDKAGAAADGSGIEPVEGFDVDGCFTLPDARLPDLTSAEGNDSDC